MTQLPPLPEMSGPRALLWDMDGTLVDTEPYWMNAEREIIDEFGGEWTPELGLQCVGKSLLDCAEIIRSQGSVDLEPVEIVNQMLVSVAAQVDQEVPWRPGALDLIARAQERDIPCALVTMSWASLAERVIAHTPKGAFSVIVTGDIVSQGKPHPEPYLRAASDLGLAPQDCLAIEDSPTGVASALAAKVPTLGVAHILPIPEQPGLVTRSSVDLSWTELTAVWEQSALTLQR